MLEFKSDFLAYAYTFKFMQLAGEEVSRMARRCVVCGKGTETGYAVSHSNIKTKRNWKANIQKVKALVEGKPCRVTVCTRCLKAGKVTRVV